MATQPIVLPLDLDHTYWRHKGKPFWYKDEHCLVYGITEERYCPACAYLRGFEDGKKESDANRD
ncbi:MAG: hypothetical protein ABIH46_11520 [Chloroflexota bacterium]